MRETFESVTRHLESRIGPGEVTTAWFAGEVSDFVRFNRGRVRQPGSVRQQSLTVDLITGARHAAGTVTLSGEAATDRGRIDQLVEGLRGALSHVPEDPYLLVNTEPRSTELVEPGELPEATVLVERILERASDFDFVGIYAGGRIYRGFASSLGQRNWFERPSFNLDWSLYHHGDKAVKCGYAGTSWDDDAFAARLRDAAAQLEVLARPARTIEPGAVRAYLAPAAVRELLTLLAWGGFGLKSHRTRQTVFLKMIAEDARLSPAVSLVENTADGAGPAFGPAGFLKAGRVELIRDGRYTGTLCSPRSAREYGVPTNGASDDEIPAALDMAGGELPAGEVLARLGTGVYVNNLWYLNYSDKPGGRVTGMTRFATLWVEDGEVVAPLNVMRFDETLYRMLGENLEGLTRERDFVLDPDTYGQRSTGCAWVPGALVRDLRFTL